MARSSKKAAVPVVPAVAPRALNIKEAAAYLCCTVWFLRTLVWGRKIPYLQLGHSYVFDVADLNRFLDNNKVAVSG